MKQSKIFFVVNSEIEIRTYTTTKEIHIKKHYIWPINGHFYSKIFEMPKCKYHWALLLIPALICAQKSLFHFFFFEES